MNKPAPCKAIAENFEAWVESLPTPYRQAWYRGRANARSQMADREVGHSREHLNHQRALSIYEARAEAAE